MEPFPDLQSLQTVLEALEPRGLVRYLSPPGQKRGVVVTHGLYPADEFEKVRQAFSQQAFDDVSEGPVRAAATRSVGHSEPGWITETTALRAEIETLKASVANLTSELRELKSALGV